MKILELNHTALFVSDIVRSVRFYGEQLGFPAIQRPTFDFPGAWFRLGREQELHLIGGRIKGPVAATGHFALRVDDLEAVKRHLRRQRIAFHAAEAPRPDGARQIFVEDPDGHLIEFCDHLPDGQAGA